MDVLIVLPPVHCWAWNYKNEVSIPVGYERQLIMRTLDFEEFIWALVQK